MGKIFLKNVTLENAAKDILISDGRISRIRPSGEMTPEGEVTVFKGETVVPSFVNMHVHTGMVFMRGMYEDCHLQEWLRKIWEIEEKVTPEYIHHASKVAALELIRTGTTTVNDQYWHQESSAPALGAMGLRGAVSYIMLDGLNNPSKAQQDREGLQAVFENSAKWNKNTKFAVSIHAEYTVCEENIVWATEFAKKHDLLIHLHLSETEKEVKECMERHGGLSPVEYFDRLGVLTDKTIAAHTLWLSEKDIEILGSRKVSCVHNINSNLKLASGSRFLYNELRDAGANICLGTDGAASSNNLDMLEAMKTAAFTQKSWRHDASALHLNELFDMATVNGANALGIKSGKIEEGYLADMLIVDTDNTFFLSGAPFLANFIYSAHSNVINSVICDGKFLMKNHKIEGEEAILDDARQFLRTNKFL